MFWWWAKRWVFFKCYYPFWCHRPARWRKTEIVWMWGWSFVLILCLNCCVIAPCCWFVAEGCQRSEQTCWGNWGCFYSAGPCWVPECLQKKPFLGWKGSSCAEGTVQVWSWWICANLHHCQGWNNEWQMCHSSAKLSCTQPRLCSLNTLNKFVHVFVDEFGDAHAFWQKQRNWKIFCELWIFSSPKITHCFQHSISFVLVNKRRTGIGLRNWFSEQSVTRDEKWLSETENTSAESSHAKIIK